MDSKICLTLSQSRRLPSIPAPLRETDSLSLVTVYECVCDYVYDVKVYIHEYVCDYVYDPHKKV